ncbi:MAG: hypothetical protein RR620_08675 [Clostridium sp.]
MMDLLKMFEGNEEIKKFNEVQAEKATPQKIVKEKTAKNQANSKTKAAPKAPVLSKNEKLEKECQSFTKIIIKVFGAEILSIEDAEDIKAIKLDTIGHRLINEYHFEEFGKEIIWNLVPSVDKLTGILIPFYKFQQKG